MIYVWHAIVFIFLIYRDYLVSVYGYQVYQARLLRMLAEPRGSLSSSTCVLDAEPSKHDTKRHEPDILFIILPIG